MVAAKNAHPWLETNPLFRECQLDLKAEESPSGNKFEFQHHELNLG